MLNVQNASVDDVLNELKAFINSKGIRACRRSSQIGIGVDINEFAEQNGFPYLLQKFIVEDVFDAFLEARSIVPQEIEKHLIDKGFSGITYENVEQQVNRESQILPDIMASILPKDPSGINDLIDFDYAKTLVPDVTEEEYKRIDDAIKSGEITTIDIAHYTTYCMSTYFENQIKLLLSNPRRLSKASRLLYSKKIDWTGRYHDIIEAYAADKSLIGETDLEIYLPFMNNVDENMLEYLLAW